MLLRSGAGVFEIDDISNNNVTASVPMGQVGPEWAVSGFGDFSGNAGETDMLMRNSNTGNFEVYDIGNNAINNAAPMGQVGVEWQVAGFGDFSGHAGENWRHADAQRQHRTIRSLRRYEQYHHFGRPDGPSRTGMANRRIWRLLRRPQRN